jgi:DNA-binding NarL/FixJ family response regulator
VIGLLVVAPSLAVRAGLRALLGEEPDLELIAEAGTLAELAAMPAGADVVLMAPEAAEAAELEALLEAAPGRVGLILMGEDTDSVSYLAELPLRGWGMVIPDASAEELFAAVRAVHEGLIAATPALLEPLLDLRLVADRPEDALVEPLTDRELQVLGLLADGLANKQIGAALDISEHTVKFHVSSIYAKLGATNRAEAVRLGARQGLILL